MWHIGYLCKGCGWKWHQDSKLGSFITFEMSVLTLVSAPTDYFCFLVCEDKLTLTHPAIFIQSKDWICRFYGTKTIKLHLIYVLLLLYLLPTSSLPMKHHKYGEHYRRRCLTDADSSIPCQRHNCPLMPTEPYLLGMTAKLLKAFEETSGTLHLKE